MLTPAHPLRDISLVYVLVLVLATLGRLSGLWMFDTAVAIHPY
jgi:hypothetical protein